MTIGSPIDIASRLKNLLPARWFPDSAPIIEAMLAGFSDSLSWLYSLITYVKNQTRIETASDNFLDLIAYDFFALQLQRKTQESDDAFRVRIIREILRQRGTRIAISSALTDLTGRAPSIFEPRNPSDTGGYSQSCLSYSAAGAYGSLNLPFQVLVQAFRPSTSGIPILRGYGVMKSASIITNYAFPSEGISKSNWTFDEEGVPTTVTPNAVIWNGSSFTRITQYETDSVLTTNSSWVMYNNSQQVNLSPGQNITLSFEFKVESVTNNPSFEFFILTDTEYFAGVIYLNSLTFDDTLYFWSSLNYTHTLIDLGNGFYRIVFVATIETNVTQLNCSFGNGHSLPRTNASILLGKIQLEIAPSNSPYLRTKTSPASANAKVGIGGYGYGQLKYASLSEIAGNVTDNDIYSTIESVRPAGTIDWVKISN